MAFPLIRVIPQYSEHQNQTKIWFAPLDGSNTSARLFIKEPINGLQVCIAWRYRLHRQAVPQRNPETHQAISGNFPKIKHMHISYNSCISIKFNVNNSPNLVSLVYFEIVFSSPLITNALPLTLYQCSSFPHSILTKLSIFVLLSLYSNNKCRKPFLSPKFSLIIVP